MNEYIVTINDIKKNVKVISQEKIEIDGREIEVSFQKISPHSITFKYENRVYEVALNKNGKESTRFLVDGWYYDAIVRTKLQEAAIELQKNISKEKHHTEVKAPMPGLILKIKKKIGDKVELGEPILILEAMKMENDIHSPASGVVKNINFQEGQSVEKNSIIIVIE